jgi:hypothetical protein
MICSLLLSISNDYAMAAMIVDDSIKHTERIKAQVRKKEGRNVTVELNDQSKWKGHIGSVGAESFQIDVKNGEAKKEIQYSDVKEISGGGLSKGAKIALIVGGGVAVLAVIAVVSLNHTKFGNGNLLRLNLRS